MREALEREGGTQESRNGPATACSEPFMRSTFCPVVCNHNSIPKGLAGFPCLEATSPGPATRHAEFPMKLLRPRPRSCSAPFFASLRAAAPFAQEEQRPEGRPHRALRRAPQRAALCHPRRTRSRRVAPRCACLSQAGSLFETGGPARPRPLPRAHGLQRQHPLSARHPGRVLPAHGDEFRRRHQCQHRLRPHALHDRAAQHEGRDHRRGPARHGRLCRRPPDPGQGNRQGTRHHPQRETRPRFRRIPHRCWRSTTSLLGSTLFPHRMPHRPAGHHRKVQAGAALRRFLQHLVSARPHGRDRRRRHRSHRRRKADRRRLLAGATAPRPRPGACPATAKSPSPPACR